MKVFHIDLTQCSGCYCCQVACKDEHVGNDWGKYAKPQPDVGQFWLRLDEKVRGQVPKVKVTYIPFLCNHCDDAPCVRECKSGAIEKRKDGLVVIDPTKCTGCKLCKDACPYDAIYFNENLNIAQKCTGCAHLLDNDPDWKVPRCVDNCPTDAIKFGEEKDLKGLLKEAETLKPAAGAKPRVYYKGLPKKFVAGTVYDPQVNEVVIGAKCTLVEAGKKTPITETTNNFGDFWFNGLKDNATYNLKIEKNGKTKTVEGIVTSKDLSLGDIPMEL